MKNLFKVLLGVLFLGSVGIAMADEDDHRDDRDRDHAKVRIVIAPKRHHRRPKRHVETHSSINVRIGDGDHHEEHHDDHHDENR